MDLTTLHNFHLTTLIIVSCSHLPEESIHFLLIALRKGVEVGLYIFLTAKAIVLSTVEMKNRTLLWMMVIWAMGE